MANAKLVRALEQARVRFREASAKLQELEARVIEAEQAKIGGADVTRLEAKIAALKAENAALKTELHHTIASSSRFASKPRTPKAEKPPLPPDEERERTIKGLKTKVRNLTAELDAIRELNNKLAMRTGDMSRETRTAIDKVLHPDARATEADRDRAIKGWNAWKNDRQGPPPGSLGRIPPACAALPALECGSNNI